VFVTSQGHAHARFRRALLSKNVKLIEAASRELQHVGLDDALRVLIVFAERRDARYERAATRFAARVMLERRLGSAEARTSRNGRTVKDARFRPCSQPRSRALEFLIAGEPV
jgi:hypothetical protein